MDAGFFTEEGNLAVMARSDDVINVAGHRLSTGALEEVLDMFYGVSYKRLTYVIRYSLSTIMWTYSMTNV